MTPSIDFRKYINRLRTFSTLQSLGKVTKMVGLVAEANGPVAPIGSLCEIVNGAENQRVVAEVSGFRGNKVLLMPLEEVRGIRSGSLVTAKDQRAVIPVGDSLLGRIIDGLGNPIDGKGPVDCGEEYPIYRLPMNPLSRKRIQAPLDTGVRAVNGTLTLGAGQRIGIFAGSGVGKSVLMGMIARNSSADVKVIALIGERGREVNEFIDKELGPEGLRQSVVVAATSDHLPLIRMRAAFIATAIAEYFRDRGLQVILMMDSITRFAMAQREIGLAIGEPPATKGYTPSVFTLLPKLLERAGTSANCGTITGIYTVLVEGEDMNEPIADAVRYVLDGHIVLSRELAMKGHFPGIDVLKSISRVMDDIVEEGHVRLANRLKESLAVYRRAEDLINIGAYVSGSNPKIDAAVSLMEPIEGYLRQDMHEAVDFKRSLEELKELFREPRPEAACAGM